MLVSGLSGDSGLLFTSGNRLRYLAPDRTGNFTAVYQVAGPDGLVDQAQVTIAVREAVVATNTAPVPTPIVARVLSGERVRMTVPLTGTDPDGDSVQLLGLGSNPEKGSVSTVGVDFIDYVAGDYSAGTDTFSYTVIDALGARATGEIRVGISPRTEGARNPIAVADEVRSRPGNTVSVQVLLNDSDPDGSELTIVDVQPNSPDIEWTIVDDVVEVTAPSDPARYGLVYTIENATGGTSSSFITVIVDPDAPPSYPVAKDTVLTLSDIIDRDSVDVDVLRNVFFADGDNSSLDLSVLAGFGDTASVTPAGRVRVVIAEQRQIIPFSVANPDDPSIVAYAFIWVPGFADALPQLDRTASPPTIPSESALTIDLADYVIAVGGKQVRLTDSTSVQATHANGDDLVVDDHTLRYTSAEGYFGPASISFEVTDGTTASDPDGRRATLVLPITVTSRENQPPVFGGAVIDFEPGEQRTIDLLKLTAYDYPDDLAELQFTALSTPPAGFTFTIEGSSLDIRADPDAAKGLQSTLTIGVRDDVSEGQSGRIRLGVVASTRPLARPAPDSVVVPRGQSTTVDVLANDQATNPFPGTKLSVLAIGGLDGAPLPDGVSVAPNADRSSLTVTVAATALPIDTNLQYQVADVTLDPTRFAFGTIRISVQDRPEAPVAPSRADGGFEEGQLTLRLSSPLANNSPIVRYEVTSSSHGDYRHNCELNLRCALTDLEAGLRYQFAVVAVNAIGTSDSSPSSVVLSADYLPAAPVSVAAVPTADNRSGAAIAVSWTGVPDPDPGSQITGYNVRVTGAGVDYSTTVGSTTTTLSTTANGALAPNQQYTVTVYARNSALVLSDADWRRTSSAPVTTVGPPSQVAGGVSAVVVGTTGDIQVSWGASEPNGAGGVSYSVGRLPASTAAPSSCELGSGNPGVPDGAADATSGWIDTSTTDRDTYQYVVYAQNGFFCTPTVSGAVETKEAPGAAVGTVAVQARGGQFDLRVGALSVTSGLAVRYQAQVNGGAWFAVVSDQWLTSAADLSVYGFPQSVVFRGCRDSGAAFCGPGSTAEVATPVNARGSIVSCTIGSVPISSPPVNGNSPAVEYLYAYNDGGIVDVWTPYEANAAAPSPALVGSGVTSVRLKSVVTFDAGPGFQDTDYAEGTCTP